VAERLVEDEEKGSEDEDGGRIDRRKVKGVSERERACVFGKV